MNLPAVALALLAWQLISSQNGSKTPTVNLTSFLSDDTRNVLDCVEKLSSKDCPDNDKMGALMQMLGNPAIINVAQSVFCKPTEQKNPEPPLKNDEGFVFETPSQNSKEFFKPIDDIADAEVKNKLYSLYDRYVT